jgi:hypothetical protein
MAVNIITLRTQDDESDTKQAAFPIYVPTGFTLAEYQAVATNAAPLLDAVTESQIVAADMTIALTLPGGLKGAPVASALNERGGLVGWDTAGQFGDSYRIPAILHSIMSGNEFAVTNPLIDALNQFFILGSGTVIPRTRDGFTWTAPTYGRKSLRRK